MESSFDRRAALSLGLGAATWALAPKRGLAQAPATPPIGATVINREFKRLSPNCYAFLQLQARGQTNLSVSNCGVVVGPKSLLVIDTTGGPEHARQFAAAVRTLNKPVDKVVITHEHIDHIVGLPLFAGADVISQQVTRDQMVKLIGSPKPAYWANNPAWATPADRYDIVVPNITYTDKMSLWYGDTQVDFVFPGRAHTSGDTLIHLPKEKIIFMGDIAFFGVTPLNGSGFIGDWIKVCDKIIADPLVETIVPGHGPVGGKRELADMKGYLELLYREGRKKFDAKVTPGRAAAEIDLGRYATWTDANRIVNNLVRLYMEFSGDIRIDTDRAAVAAATAEYNALRKR